MKENERLSQKRGRLIPALLSECSIGKAAASVGINESTAWRWLKEPAFQDAYRAACKQVVDSAIGSLQAACAGAVDALKAVMDDGEAPASSRVTAARAVLELSLKGVELQDLEARIGALEELVKGGDTDDARTSGR